VARRTGWTFVDQALSSLTNFALGVLVARSVSPKAFGAFSVAYLLFIFLNNIGRAVGSEPMVVRFSTATADVLRAAAGRATGMALALGIITGAGCLAAGQLFDASLRPALVALAVSLPGLMVQDAWRYVFMAEGRPAKAAGNDMIFAAVQLAAVAALIAADRDSVSTLVLAWGAAATVAAVAGIAQARTRPHLTKAWAWLVEHRDVAPSFLADYVMLIGAAQLTLFSVGAISGLTDLGALRAGAVLLGPLTTVLTGARLIAVPEIIRLRERAPERFLRTAVVLSAAGTAAAAVFGVIGTILPAHIGVAFLGESWPKAHDIFPYLAAGTAGVAANIGPLTGLRILADARRILLSRVVSAPLVIIGGIVGDVLGRALGAAFGMAIATWLGTAWWWRHFLAAIADDRLGGRADRRDPPAALLAVAPE
jgi:O-antigen/teichoic acid export membrane protein